MSRRIIKIPKSASIKCPECYKKSRLALDHNLSYLKWTCPKCEKVIERPMMQCCIVCAFSNKKCPQSLKMEAAVHHIPLKYA